MASDGIGGSVGSVITLAVGVGLAVIVLVFFGVMTANTYNIVDDVVSDIANHDVLSFAFTANNTTAQSLGNVFIQEGSLSVLNASSAEMLLTNFTIDYDEGIILYLGDDNQNGDAMTANYTWGVKAIRENIQGAIGSGFESFENTGSYMPIMVLAVIIALVFSIVIGFSTVGKSSSNVL